MKKNILIDILITIKQIVVDSIDLVGWKKGSLGFSIIFILTRHVITLNSR